MKELHYPSLSHVIFHAILTDISDIQYSQLTYEFQQLDQWYLDEEPEIILRNFVMLGKAIESSLITLNQLSVPAFFSLEQGTSLPAFLYSTFSTIFTDSGKPRYIRDASGRIVDADGFYGYSCIPTMNTDCVFLLRQFFLAFAKAEDVSVPEGKEQSQINEFVERATKKWDVPTSPFVRAHLATARLLLSDLLMPDGKLHAALAQWEDEPFGRHGPGAVSGREKGLTKWRFEEAPNLDSRLYSDAYGQDLLHEEKHPKTARLCLVPKDLRGKRLICIEPKEHQFAQQGIAKVLTDIIHHSRLSCRHINLSRQDLSFNMSSDDRFSTIDLKDASDSISLGLLRILFPKDVFALLTRYRTRCIELPDGTLVPSQIGFTMGNALCFPVETLVFWALTTSAYLMANHGNIVPSVSPSEVSRMRLRIYGDDIIILNRHYERVLAVLEGSGLRPNLEKCCNQTTLVREACGSWFYASRDCVITKFHYAWSMGVRAWISFENTIQHQLDRGLLNLARCLEEICDGIYPLPDYLLSAKRDGFTRVLVGGEFVDIHRILRYNPSFQRLEYRRPVVGSVAQRPLPGHLGITAYWTDQALGSSYADLNKVKYEWTPIL